MNLSTKEPLPKNSFRSLCENSLDYVRYNSYLSQKYKIFYVATPKVACTSLKWWFAALEGYDKQLHSFNDSVESMPEMVIHDGFYRVAPMVTHLSLDDLTEALCSSCYFRFALVRNPYKRIFSAWQSKVLLMEPYQTRPYVDCDFIHHRVDEANDITSAFEAFLEYLAANEAPKFMDVHWTPQVDLLRPDIINYSRLDKIEDSGELLKAIESHSGFNLPDPFSSRRSNESLIPYLPQFVSRRSAELIRSLYAADFDIFGYDKNPPKSKEHFSDEQINIALKAVYMIRGRHQQLENCNRNISYLKKSITGLEKEIFKLSSKVSEVGEMKSSLIQEVAVRDKELVAYAAQADEFAGQVKALEANLSFSQDAIAARDVELNAYRIQADEFAGQVKALEANLSFSQDAIAARDVELNAYRIQADEFARNILSLQDEFDNTNTRRAQELKSLKFLTGQLLTLLVSKAFREKR